MRQQNLTKRPERHDPILAIAKIQSPMLPKESRDPFGADIQVSNLTNPMRVGQLKIGAVR
jgi:hypothetical protein